MARSSAPKGCRHLFSWEFGVLAAMLSVKGLFCATEMDGTYSAWRTRNDIPEGRSLEQGPIALGGGETFRRYVRNGSPNS